MKLLHFVDAAGTDEHYVPAKNVNLIETINAANLKVWFSNSDSNVSDHNVQVGVTSGTADECLLALSEIFYARSEKSHAHIGVVLRSAFVFSLKYSVLLWEYWLAWGVL